MLRQRECCTVIVFLLLAGSSTGPTAAETPTTRKKLLGVPLVVPKPFEKPQAVAESAQEAIKAGTLDAYTKQMCQMFADPKLQGTREFGDIQGVFIYPMIQSVARATYTQPAGMVDAWGQVFARCNGLQLAAEGLGYAAAYVYTEGVIESLGLTQLLDSAYKQGGGCKAVNTILDVAAAVITQRTVSPNQLSEVMKDYSKLLAPCTPADAQIKFVPVNPVAAAVAAKKARPATPATKATAAQMMLSVPAVALESGG